MPLLQRVRVPHAAADLSPDFLAARAGGLAGAEDSVAIHGGAVYVITDEHGGRRLHEERDGRLCLVPPAGRWISRLSTDEGLTAWEGSPLSDQTSARSLEGSRWRPSTVHSRPRSITVWNHARTVSLHARRRSPGLSVCGVYDHERKAVAAQWVEPLMGRPIWADETFWLLYEAWPHQQLVALHRETFDVVERHELPVGRLASLASAPGRIAAIWSDAWTPASLILATSVSDLLAQIHRHEVTRESNADVPYTESITDVAGVPSMTYTPYRAPTGTIVLLHGGPHLVSWPTFSPLVAFLCRQGWRVTRPNVCSSAIASRRASAAKLGIDDAGEVARIAAAHDPSGPVVIVGWSYGAYLAARSLSFGARPRGLVCLSGFLHPRVISGSTNASINRFTGRVPLPPTCLPRDLPVLAIHGVHDDRVPYERQRDDVVALANGRCVPLPGEGHGIQTDPGAATAYSALASWLTGL